MEFLTGALVGFIIAVLIGREKFLKRQEKLRTARDNFKKPVKSGSAVNTANVANH